MTDNIPALIAEARAFADRNNGLDWQGRIRELADALESLQEQIAGHGGWDGWIAEHLRVEADRDRYRAAIEEIDDWMTRHYLDTHVGGIVLAMTERALNENGAE